MDEIMSNEVYKVEVNRQGATHYYYSEGVGVPQLVLVMLDDDTVVKYFVIPLSYLAKSKEKDKVLIGTIVDEDEEEEGQ